MRNTLILFASMVAGFVGAILAMLIFGDANVTAGPKSIAVDTLRATHIIVDGDIRVESTATTVLDVTNPGGGHLRIGNNAGIPQADGKMQPGSGSFLVEMGPDLDHPNVIVSDLGVAVLTRSDKSAFLTQLSTGLKLSYYSNGQRLSSTLDANLQPGKLEFNSNSLTPLQDLGTLDAGGLTCQKYDDKLKLNDVKCR